MKPFVVLVPFILLVAGCALEPKQSGEAVTNSVTISGFAFRPGTAHLTKGQTVTFTNQDSAGHNIRWDSLPTGGTNTSSPDLGQGGAFEYTPAVAGQYDYHCGKHPNMKGSLVVAEGGTP